MTKPAGNSKFYSPEVNDDVERNMQNRRRSKHIVFRGGSHQVICCIGVHGVGILTNSWSALTLYIVLQNKGDFSSYFLDKTLGTH